MKLFPSLLLLFVLSGCATITSLPFWTRKKAPVFYSGTRCDVELLLEYGISYDPIYILDLPFSFLLDSLLLPVSLPFAATMSRWHREMYQFAPNCYDGES